MHTQVQSVLAALRVEGTGVPIYVQLRQQLLQALGSGMLSPGDQMPTMRQVAVALRIDLNTVRHAYDALERMGAITLVRGRGSFVAEGSPPPPSAKAAAAQTDALALQTLAAAAAAGIDAKTLAKRIVDLSASNGERP